MQYSASNENTCLILISFYFWNTNINMYVFYDIWYKNPLGLNILFVICKVCIKKRYVGSIVSFKYHYGAAYGKTYVFTMMYKQTSGAAFV